jgi:DNA-binding NtrC family response regulator
LSEPRDQGRREPRTLPEILAEHERVIIIQALVRCRGSRTAAAAALGIGRRRLYRRLRVLEIDVPAVLEAIERADPGGGRRG